MFYPLAISEKPQRQWMSKERAVINKPVKRRPDDAAPSLAKRRRLSVSGTRAEGAFAPNDAAAATVAATSATQVKNDGDVVTMRSEDLMGHREKIEILHNGERYVLRLTRLGRLILTK